MRRAWMLGLAVVVVGTIGMSTVAAGVADGGVRPKVWVGRVCRAVRPAAEELAARMDTAGDFVSGGVPDAEDAIRKVQILDELVGGLRDALAGMRAGIVDAGVPRIPHGRRTVRLVVRDLDHITRELDAARGAFARFPEEAATDPRGAAQLVAGAIEQHLSRDVLEGLLAHWPSRLKAAMDASPACIRVSRLLKSAIGRL